MTYRDKLKCDKWNRGVVERRKAILALPAALFLWTGSGMARPVLAQEAKATAGDALIYIKRVLKKGDVRRYTLDITNQVGEMQSTLRLQFKETTKDAKPEGEFTLLDEIESVSALVDGSVQNVTPEDTAFLPMISVIRDKTGKLFYRIERGNPAAGTQISHFFQSLYEMLDSSLPKMPVKTGDKWKVSVAMSGPAGGEAKSEGSAVLLGAEVFLGIKSVKVKIITDTENKEQLTSAHSETTMNLDPDTGKPLKVTTKVDGTTHGMKLAWAMELNLIPEEKAEAADKK